MSDNGLLVGLLDANEIARFKEDGDAEIAASIDHGTDVFEKVVRVEVEKLRNIFVDEGAEGKTRCPRICEIVDRDIRIAFGGFLAPLEKDVAGAGLCPCGRPSMIESRWHFEMTDHKSPRMSLKFLSTMLRATNTDRRMPMSNWMKFTAKLQFSIIWMHGRLVVLLGFDLFARDNLEKINEFYAVGKINNSSMWLSCF